MLNSVYMDGLRSLKDIELDLNPGLNVLVGPNGSGKSNILIAFEFISFLNRLEFLNELGAVGSVKFTDLFDIHRAIKCIKIKLDGESKIESKDFATLRYEYDCKIEFATELDDKLEFSFQSLKLHSKKQGEIFRMEFNKGTVGRTRVHPKLGKSFEIDNLQEPADEDTHNQLLKLHYQSNTELLKCSSLIREVGLMFRPFQVIGDELNSMKLFNFDPNRIRNDDKKKVTPEIRKDGTGLTSVLHEIWRLREIDKPISKSEQFRYTNFQNLHVHIIGFIRLLDSEFIDIEVNFDSLTKEIECEVLLKNTGNGKISVPLKLMSDGTLKWMSLTTALLTIRHMFILEAPEYYLNTSMLLEFAEIVRSFVGYNDNFALITTQSETLLDKIEPEEMFITFLRDGYTHITKIENIKLLNGILRESDHGLGWYYATFSLEPDSNGRVLPLK